MSDRRRSLIRKKESARLWQSIFFQRLHFELQCFPIRKQTAFVPFFYGFEISLYMPGLRPRIFARPTY